MQTEAQKRANAKYKAKNYEQLNIKLKKGEKDKLKALAQAEGKGLNEYIRSKIF